MKFRFLLAPVVALASISTASAVPPPPAHIGASQQAVNAMAPLRWILGSWKGSDEVIFPNGKQSFPIYLYATTTKSDPGAILIYVYFVGGGGTLDFISQLTLGYSTDDHRVVGFRSRSGSAGMTPVTIGADNSISWDEAADETHYPATFKLAPNGAALAFSNTVTGRDAPFDSGQGLLSKAADRKLYDPLN